MPLSSSAVTGSAEFKLSYIQESHKHTILAYILNLLESLLLEVVIAGILQVTFLDSRTSVSDPHGLYADPDPAF
jgi:type III secretory pathway component EscU